MAYEKMVQLVRALLEKTKLGKLEWQETEREGVFQSSFSAFSVRTMTRESHDEWNNTDIEYGLGLHNDKGALIEEIWPETLAVQGSIALLREVYEYARRHAMGVENALNTILEELGPPSDEPF